MAPLSQSSASGTSIASMFLADMVMWLWLYFNGSRAPNALHQAHTRKIQAKPAKKSPAGLTSTGLRRP